MAGSWGLLRSRREQISLLVCLRPPLCTLTWSFPSRGTLKHWTFLPETEQRQQTYLFVKQSTCPLLSPLQLEIWSPSPGRMLTKGPLLEWEEKGGFNYKQTRVRPSFRRCCSVGTLAEELLIVDGEQRKADKASARDETFRVSRIRGP